MDQGRERPFPEPSETTSRALRQQRDFDEMEGIGRRATAKGKEWEEWVWEETDPKLCLG